mgnify:CR=1 FL=1
MKNKKIIMYLIIILIILIILFVGYLIYKNIKNKNTNEILEYIPEEEITDEQLRETIITLYFMNMDTGNLMAEARKIDAKELLDNPYKKIIELLIEGPKNERLVKLIPENTKLNNAEIINDIIYLDFSSEFINEQSLGEEQEKKIINSIINTLTELNEVNGIYITINGEKDLGFPDNGVKFNNIFTREK